MVDEAESKLLLIFMFFALFLFAFFLSRILKKMDNPYDYRGQSYKNRINALRQNKRDSFYQKLTTAHQPFNWRIASALSIAQLSKKEVNRFLSALEKVLTAENKIIRKFDSVNQSNLELLINPFIKKDRISEIDQLVTNFESYYLLEEASADEALDYFLNLEISNFSNNHFKIQGIEDNEAPF